MRRWGVWLAVAGLVSVSGCFSTPLPAPTSSVVLSSGGWGDFVLHVYDDTRLITGARQNEEPPQGDTATAFPERQEVELALTGGACAHRPILNVTGDPLQLRLELEPGPSDPQWPFFECPAVGIRLGVTLSLSAPVAQAALTLQVNH